MKLWILEEEQDYDADAFRQRVYARHISKELLQLLPGSDNKGQETDAEAAFRQRMCNLLQTVQERLGQGQEGAPAKSAKGGRPRALHREQLETIQSRDHWHHCWGFGSGQLGGVMHAAWCELGYGDKPEGAGKQA